MQPPGSAMAADEASLQALSKILTEFYSGSVDAERRSAIHNILTTYEQTPTAWYSALYYIYATSEQCVALYSLGVIERSIVNRWSSMTEEDKSELLRVLRFYLFERFARLDSSFLAKKTAQVLALITCLDGARLCAPLLEHLKLYLLSCMENHDFVKTLTGLHALQVIIEQMIDPCEVIGSMKSAEVRSWFMTETVTVYNLLSRAMLCLVDNKVMSQAQILLLNSCSSDNQSTLSEAGYSAFQLTQTLISDNSEQSTNKCHALLAWLDCLSETVKRLPFDFNFLGSFYNALFLLSLIGSPAFISACVSDINASVNNRSSPMFLLSSICLTSLSCVHEIVDRKDLTTEVMQKNLIYIFPILQFHLSLNTGDTTIPWCGTSTNQQLKSYDRNLAEAVAADTQNQSNTVEYQMKLLDILKSVMTNFFFQLFISPALTSSLSINPFCFLGLLHDFTFATTDLDTYLSSLNLWNSFLEFIQMRYCSTSSTSLPCDQLSSIPADIHSPLLTLGKTLFSRLLHSEAANFIETLDEDASEDGSEYAISCCSNASEDDDMMMLFSAEHSVKRTNADPSEYRVFIRETLTTFSLVLGLVPIPLINIVLERYYASCTDYVNIVQSSTVVTSGEFIFELRGQPLHRVHWTLRDFATITQTIGFIFEFITTASSHSNDGNSFSVHGVLQSLIYCLNLNQQLVPTLSSLKQSLIRSDFITVIVENLMTLQSVILGNHIMVTNNEVAPVFGKILLTTEEKDEFLIQIMQIVAAFLLPVNGISLLVPLPVQVCSARLFGAICASPLFSASAINRSSITNLPTIQECFVNILNSLFDDKRRALFPFNVLRLLLRSCVQCLSEHNSETVISDMLEKLTLSCYSPHLTQSFLQKDPDTHLLWLGLLNDAVDCLDSCSSSARRYMQTILVNCGIKEELTRCVTSILTSGIQASSNMVNACAAYFTFFATYLRVLSQGTSISASIPELLGSLIRAIYPNATVSQQSTQIPTCLIDRLLSMFLLIAKIRRLFISLVGDILDLCIYRILPQLGLLNSTIQVPNVENLPTLVVAAGMNNPSSFKLLCEVLFATLTDGFGYFFERKTRAHEVATVIQKSDLLTSASQRYVLTNPGAFNHIMSILTAVFHESQVDSSVVLYVLDSLNKLNQLRKFFSLEPFNRHWLPEFLRCLLNLLINKHHDSCKDALLSGLYSLVQHTVETDANKSVNHLNRFAFFVQYFLPAYLETLPYLDTTQRSSVLTAFYRSPQLTSSNVPTPVELIDLSDPDTFCRAISQLVVDLRAFHAFGIAPLKLLPPTTFGDTKAS